jgi:2-methylcitrate dehydratase PrpD
VKVDVISNSRAIAEYVAESRGRTLPAEVLEAARMCLVDWVGVATGAHAEPAGRVVRAAVNRWNAQGRSSLLLGGSSGAAMAALCNGTLAHCLDFDDTYVKANTHTSAPVWAAALAMGEELGASEREMLGAFITGFEVAARVGYGLGEAVTARGFHATGVFGRIGAAAACAVLMKLGVQQTQHALGAAATQASGLVGSFGTMSKPFHAGKAAMDGVLSAQLAGDGFEAATELLDPGGGLDNAIIQDRAFGITPADFSSFEILNNSFKPYAACHLTHPAIDAARDIRLSLDQVDGIQAIHVAVGALAYQVTGEKSGYPLTPLEAKFDLKYCVALALAGRPLSASDFADPLVSEPGIALAVDRMETTSSPALGYASATIEAVFRDGRRQRCEIAVAKGHPGNPMTWGDMRAKFEGLVEPVAGSSTQDVFDGLKDFGGESGGGLKTIRLLSAALND